MLYPSINLLRSKADSSYTLVIMAAKRARDLIEGKPKLTAVESNKPVTIATNEIAEELISYTREEKSSGCEETEAEAAGGAEDAFDEAAAAEEEDGEAAVSEDAAEAVQNEAVL